MTDGDASGFGAVLAPLAARHAHWMGLGDAEMLADRDEAAADIRAMQLVLRMERSNTPAWSSALAAACTAATALCLDERSAPGGEWHDAVAGYVRAHIRKVTRRARATQWDAVQELPGLTVDRRGTEVRALVPGPVTDLDKRVAKLQVGGTDVPVNLAAVDLAAVDPAAVNPAAVNPAAAYRPAAGLPRVAAGVLLLLIPEHIPMTTGKLMAQTGHAGMITAALLAGSHSTDGTDGTGRLRRWWNAGLPVQVARLTAAAWSAELAVAGGTHAWEDGRVAVRDAGFTEIDPGTVTVVANATGL